MDNPSQQPSIDQQPSTSLSATIPHKSKLPLFILIVISVLVIFSGTIYVLKSKNTNQQKQVSVVPTNSPESPTPLHKLTLSPTPKIQLEPIVFTYDQAGNQVANITLWNLQLTLPNGWNIKEQNKRMGTMNRYESPRLCADYFVQNKDGSASISLKTDCETSVLGYPGDPFDPYPTDAVVVKEFPNHYDTILRYIDSKAGAYRYVRDLSLTFSDQKPKTYVDRGIMIDGLSLVVIFAYTGNQKDVYLQFADGIVNSFAIYKLR